MTSKTTRYIDVPALSALVKSIGVEPFIVELARYIEEDYRRWDQFEKSARLASHSKVGVIELMPAADGELYGFKYVNGHPKNTFENLLTVMAFGVLAEIKTGFPLLLAELTVTTALRTAATSALAAKAMARKNSKSMAIIGNGAQSEFQVLGFRALLGINDVRAYDIDPDATQKLIENLADVPGLQITAAKSARDAVKGADIVTTVTADKANATILTRDMVEPGMHINGVGGDCPGKTELDPAILQEARVVVEFEPQTRIEGDIQRLPADFPVTELWQVLTGKKPGRKDDREITVFDSVGFALEDFSSLRYLHVLGKARDVGRKLDLVPTPENPKDLFQLVADAEIIEQLAVGMGKSFRS